MYKNKSVGVVVPAYNEEGFVGAVIRTLPEFVDRAYVIDDCSTDGTWVEIREAVASVDGAEAEAGREGPGPVVEPIRHDENRGVGGAIKTGYRRASEDGMDVVAVMNGDGQMDPAILHRIIDPVVEGQADYAKGNRLFSRDHVDGMSAWRRLGNGVLTFLTKVASGYWKMMDPQNGYTAISASALAEIEFESLYEDYGFCNDLLVRLNAHGMRIADVEMDAVYGEEMSDIRYHRFIPALSKLLLERFLWRLKAQYLVRDFHPLVGFYLVGTISTMLGTVGVTKTVVAKLRNREAPGLHPGRSVELLLLGLVSVLGAMTLDRQESHSLEAQARVDADREPTPDESADVAEGLAPGSNGETATSTAFRTEIHRAGDRPEERGGERPNGETPRSRSGD
ncbi:glycosyltransferase family 2 protein [Halobacteriales archaeon Cl-PHB]